MKRRLRVTLLSGVAALALALGGAVVPAAADTTDTSSSSSSSSSSAVTSTTTTATEDFSTSPDAAISLSTAPNISFAPTIVPDTTENGTYDAVKADNAVTVSNPGLPSGWNVQLKNSAFTDAAGDTLGGAVLSLGAPAAEAGNVGNPSKVPTSSAVALNGDGSNALLLSAPAQGGLGVWDANLDLSSVVLTVPAGQVAGSYSSTLTWQLGDTVQ